MVYNFNLGIGWASSGVEYAQAYRANIFRKIGVEAKFIFTDMFPTENIEHMTSNIGFKDEEVIWLYSFFTDTKTSPVSYTLSDLEKQFTDVRFRAVRNGKKVVYSFETGDYYTAYLVDAKKDLVHRVEFVSKGCLIRKEFYTYCRIYSEYYAPLDNKAHLYLRRFYNEDGSVSFEEIVDGDESYYKFSNILLGSKEELVGYMVSKLNLSNKDIVIIDRTSGIGQSIMQNAGQAKIGIVIHADHFSEHATNENNILWNNYYEYSFSQHKRVDFYITATCAQRDLLKAQFKKYMDAEPNIIAIPVGSVDELKYQKGARKQHGLVTASRLASEKHVDWLVEAVIKAKKYVPDITFDIFGTGAEREKLSQIISDNNASDYIRLMGHCDLSNEYIKYEAYLSASTSEGFGLSVLEAIASGLPIVGFDVRYGNQTFILDGQNGYLMQYEKNGDSNERIELITNTIVKLLNCGDIDSFRETCYKRASEFLTTEVQNKWKMLIESMM